MKSLALLMYLCMLWPALADQSQQFCLSLQPLINRELCTTVVLQTCGAAATLNATFGSDTVIPTTPFNSSDFRQCFDVPYLFGTCEMCLSFSSATFSPTSARLCPVLDVCSGAKLSGSCFTLGNDCSSSSCGSCLASSSCGWCHSQLRCIASMDSQPYCSSCNASWITDQGHCPAPPPPAPSSEGLSPSAKIAIGVLVPIGVLSAALVACFVVKRRKASRAPAIANTTIGGTSVALSGEADRDISVHSDRSISLTRPITGGPRSSEAHDSEDAHSTPLTAQISSDSLDPRYEPPTTV